MFPKCSLDARDIATLREHSANIPRILRVGKIAPIIAFDFSVFIDSVNADSNSAVLQIRKSFLGLYDR